jgi:carbon monoxide dehydrogenase subunit G
VARFTTTISTQRSPADAFAYMADFTHALQWDPSVLEARQESSGPVGVGTTFAIVSRFGPRMVPLTYRIVRHEPDRVVVLEAHGRWFVSADTITVEPAGAGARVTYDARLTFAGLARVADPLMQWVFSRVGRKAEAGLREAL